jgi:hypothetical protein
MDVYKALRELYEEKKRLDAAIAALEARVRNLTNSEGIVRGRRGRRSMSPEEREEVSRRMSRYWAARRTQSTPKALGGLDSEAPSLLSVQEVA